MSWIRNLPYGQGNAIQLETDEIVHLGLSGCCNLTDQCVINVLNKCGKLNSIDLTLCQKLTDVVVLALGTRCPQLRNINFAGCSKVSDVGISALGRGCYQLRIVVLADSANCQM
jgi:ribosomal silencing factor RsfS